MRAVNGRIYLNDFSERSETPDLKFVIKNVDLRCPPEVVPPHVHKRRFIQLCLPRRLCLDFPPSSGSRPRVVTCKLLKF